VESSSIMQDETYKDGYSSQIALESHLPLLNMDIPGLDLEIKYDKDTTMVFANVKPSEYFQGIDGRVVHEGFLAILLDEMILLLLEVLKLDERCNPLRLQYRFLKPVLIRSEIYIRAWLTKETDDIIDLQGEVENEMGKIVARIKAKYVQREL